MYLFTVIASVFGFSMLATGLLKSDQVLLIGSFPWLISTVIFEVTMFTRNRIVKRRTNAK